jgi:pimeloyl-ACP methyl ester carboxylesterase
MSHDRRPPTPPVLPPALPGLGLVLDDARAGRVRGYEGEAATTPAAGAAPMLLVHSVNAAGTAVEVRPLFEHYARSRPTYALDLPGFGLSERSARRYTPRLMTDAVHAMVREIRRRHAGAPVDALALSLSSEYLARAANEEPSAFRSLALVSPTGFNGTRRRTGPPGSTREVPGLRALLGVGLWSDALYRLLTRPGTIRYFLERTWGGKTIDEALWAYDVLTVQQPGAKLAPLDFLSATLFSNDITTLYEALTLPVWMCHGVRGDFVDFRGAEAFRSRTNWRFDVFPTGALPHFEVLSDMVAAYDAFLAEASAASAPSP